MKSCQFQNCAVCSDLKYRKMFQNILKKVFPDIILCTEAIYKVTNDYGNTFEIDLENIMEGTRGYYLTDIYTGRRIYLVDIQKLEIFCANPENCRKQPYVAVYSHEKNRRNR